MAEFVHLHVHSEYSMLDGACRVSELPLAASKLGQKALAITDHGNMYGAVLFYKECKKRNIKPIIGCEVYVAPKSRFDKDKNEKYYHLILLCRNETGYKNLCKLVSLGFTEGFYSKPRIDFDILKLYHEGLICLSACLAGEIPRLLLENRYDEAKKTALEYASLFGKDHYYLELQNHFLKEDETVLKGIAQISRETGIPMVATNDAHYIEKRHAEYQKVLLCIQTGKTLADENAFAFPNDEYYLKSTNEMEELFSSYEGALENSVKIADLCEFDFDFSKRHLPTYPLKEGESSNAVLQKLAEEGLERKKKEGKLDLTNHTFDDYKFRMIYELMMVAKMGYSDYYLIVWDFVNYAKSQGIPVGPGRGSGAGSLVAYLIDITEVDSIHYNLLFERFLNPERVSMPDFDIDFCYNRRDEVIAYVGRKYGADHVSQIAAFGTLGARAAVRDVGRVLGISYADTDSVAKLIPHKLDMTIEKALEIPELQKLYQNSLSVHQLLDTAMAVEGMPRHITTHAAGVVITKEPVSDYLPLTTSSGVVLTQYDMNTVAELGLLKFDFLALRYLTVIDDAKKEIQKKDPTFEIEKIPLEDEDTFQLISSGETDGLFQLESHGMKRLLSNMKPRSVEDIMIAIALYRPGPMESIPQLLEGRQGKTVEYDIPVLEEILEETSGCIVYQEQVMQIFRKVAGYSYGRADVVRRAMAKKHAAELEAERAGFLAGAKKNLIPVEKAEALFDSMESFASYAFNKSHAAAYAITSYRTAYLKTHYTSAYMSSLLSSVCGDPVKTSEYIASMEKKGVKLLPPSVNESDLHYTSDENSVRMGLLSVKNVGVAFAEALVEERRTNGKYKSQEDLITRLLKKGLNKGALGALISVGALDCFHVFRSRMAEALDSLISSTQEEARRSADGQIDLFAASGVEKEKGSTSYEYSNTPEYSLEKRLSLEKELTGLWISGHPLDEYSMNIAALHISPLSAVSSAFDEEGNPVGNMKDGEKVDVCGMVSKVALKTSKSGKRYALVKIEDATSEIEIFLFEKILEKIPSEILEVGRALYVSGKISIKEEERPTLTGLEVLPLMDNRLFSKVNQIHDVENTEKSEDMTDTSFNENPQSKENSIKKEITIQNTKPKRLFIKMTLEYRKDRQIEAILKIFNGLTPVIYYNPSTKEYKKSGLHVKITPYVLETLETIAGKENIVLK